MIEHGADRHGLTDRGVLYLTRADLESLALGMAQVEDAIDAAFRAKGRGAAAMPPKASLHGEAGAFSQVMTECDRFVVDDTAQAQATKAAGVRLSGIPARMHADLGELASGVKVGRERPDERIFCMNLGVAIEDVAVGSLAYRRALETGRGRHLPL